MELQEFIPAIARLDGQVWLLAESGNDGCKTLSSALEEVQHKGTLMERLTILEKRVLELSLQIHQGNTSRSRSRSRSSSSTVQDPEMIGKKDSQLSIHKRKDANGDPITTQQMEHPSTIQVQEKASPAQRIVKETTASCRRQKKKPHTKWPWLFRHTC